jgi:hypothetical protein
VQKVPIHANTAPLVNKSDGGVSFATSLTFFAASLPPKARQSRDWWPITHGWCLVSTGSFNCSAVLISDHSFHFAGTPINTDLNDLKNQLKFIGLQDVPDMMKCFNDGSIGLFKRNNKRDSDGSTSSSAIGPLALLMRSIMIRHTQAQMYSGTNTTLMSLPPMVIVMRADIDNN